MWTALFATLATAGFASASLASTEPLESRYYAPRASKIAPKVFIISLFDLEGSVWYNIPEFNVLAQNITVPGFSPLYPDAHCTRDGSICQLTAGEGEINAALSLSALIRSPSFNLRDTYFLIGGIAGVNPKVATLGSVTFARFAVQVTLQYEFDAREIPSNFATGYVPQGATAPGQYPTEIYGTEVFEVNDALRKLAVGFAKTAQLNDTSAAQAYRAHYAAAPGYLPGSSPPSVIECDTATSDTFWTGQLLATAFENTTVLFTNGTGVYCSTQQEDNALLEALLRGAKDKLVDFSRVIIMRTGSNFDRQYPGQTAAENRFGNSGGFLPALLNVHIAGVKVVEGIVDGWQKTFAKGVPPTNYIGDIFGTLGGTPDFGPGNTRQTQLWSMTPIELMHKTGVRYAIPQLRRPTGQGFRLGFRPNLRFSGASWDSKWPRKGWRNGDELSISDITPKDIASVGVSYNADLSFGGKISNLASQKMQDFPVFRHGIEDLVQRLTMKYRYVNASSSVNISLNVYEVLKTVAEIATAFVSDETSTVTVVPEMYYGGPRAHVYKHPYSGAKLCLPASYADFALVEHDKTLNSLYLDGEEGYSVVSTQKPRHILLVTTCEESSLSLRPDGPTIAHCLLLMVSHGLSEARLCRSDGKKWNFVLLRKSPKTEKLTAYWSENLASYLFKSTEGVVDISVPALSQLAVVLLEWFKPIETDLFTTVR